MPKTHSSFITRSLNIDSNTPRQFYINADGLSDQATLKVELLDHKTVPLPDYSGDNAAIVATSGFQAPVAWNQQRLIGGLPNRIRCKVTFAGQHKTKHPLLRALHSVTKQRTE